MSDIASHFPDDTPVDKLQLPTRIRNVLAAAGLQTAGEVRETSDEMLLSFQDMGKGSVALLRNIIGIRR